MPVMDSNTTMSAEVREHRRTFVTFERLVLFAAMHVVLTLGSLALAFIGHAGFIAAVIGIGGTLALIVGFAVTGSQSHV